MRRSRRQNLAYAALLAGAFLLALLLTWNFGEQVDNYAYDALVRLHPPPPREPETVILAVEEGTFRDFGGIRGIRGAIADGLERIAPARPKAVAIDVILADAVPEFDDRLERAFARTPRLVLDCLKPDEETWEYPLPRFQQLAAAVGHVYVQPDLRDQVAREIPLEQRAGNRRYWALALEA
jgi:CHASE2 domain-containing sensor protein